MRKRIYGFTKNINIFKITIYDSYFPENPLRSRYPGKLAIKVPHHHFKCPSPEEELVRLAKKEGLDPNLDYVWIDLELENNKGYVIQPVIVYESNNFEKIILRTSEMILRPDDYIYEGPVGFIYMSPDEISGHTREQVQHKLDETVEAINLFYNGEVYDADVEKLKKPEISLFNDIVKPEWEPTLYNCKEYIGHWDDLQRDLKRDIGIVKYSDTLSDVKENLIKEVNIKTFPVTVSKSIIQDFMIIAKSQSEAEDIMASADLNFDIVAKMTKEGKTE